MVIHQVLVYLSAISAVLSFKTLYKMERMKSQPYSNRWAGLHFQQHIKMDRLESEVGQNHFWIGLDVRWQTVRREHDKSQFLVRIGPNPNMKDFYKVARDAEQDELILLKRRQLECVAEVRVDPDLVMRIKRGQWKRNPDPLLKDWALCALMKAGLMTREGVYRMDAALLRVPDFELVEVESQIDSCLSSKALPAKDIAYNFIQCYATSGARYRFASIM